MKDKNLVKYIKQGIMPESLEHKSDPLWPLWLMHLYNVIYPRCQEQDYS
jgi:hypothetical protein